MIRRPAWTLAAEKLFVPKDGSDRQYHSEACHVEAGQSCDDRNKELGFPLKDAPDKDEPITFLTQ